MKMNLRHSVLLLEIPDIRTKTIKNKGRSESWAPDKNNQYTKMFLFWWTGGIKHTSDSIRKGALQLSLKIAGAYNRSVAFTNSFQDPLFERHCCL